ncbi:uncharacterized protein FYN16_015063 isoform 2-T2 [Cariama cristata]
MSAVTEEVKPEDGKPESEKKIFYCEVCKVPCMSSISLQSHYRGAKHRKKEKALRPKTVYSCSPKKQGLHSGFVICSFEPLSLFEPN